MASTSREYQRSCPGSLLRRNPPFGSLIRSMPSIVTSPVGVGAASTPVGAKPRFTSTMSPSAVRKGASSHQPAPSAVTACVRVSGPATKWPDRRTRRYSSLSAVIAAQRLRGGGGTGSAWTRASTRSISACFQPMRCHCQTPSAMKPTNATSSATANTTVQTEPRASARGVDGVAKSGRGMSRRGVTARSAACPASRAAPASCWC